MRLVFSLAVIAASAYAAQIVLPSNAFERDAPVHAIFRTGSLATGKGELKIEWTDVYGRLVDSRAIPVALDDETDIGFDLDLRRAIAMENEVRAHFSFEGVNKKGAKDDRQEDASTTFVARPPVHSWWDYNIIMWQHYNAEEFAVLKTLGINGGQSGGRLPVCPEFLLKNDLRWYAENIATDFFSAYHHYYPDRQNGWAFLQAKELYRKDPTSTEAFKRHPSLSDQIWLKRVHDRLVESATRFSPYRPFFYSLGDETGIAQLAGFWDFDFSDESLVPMREWLKLRYGTLAGLNRQWGTRFTRWDLVTPMTTNEAMKSKDDNFSAWADFKEWMDIAYASALKMGADAVHSVDPEAYIGVGGGQMPGWGGYDYSRIAESLNAIEPYDIGNNIEILRSLNPRMAVLTTGFAHGPWEKNRVWYEFLHGNRGLILWDDKREFIGKDGVVGERGRESAPYYHELRDGLGALIINSPRQVDRIAIHYSQPSMRTEWMREQRPKGEAWAKRVSSNEYRDSDFLRLRESYCRVIEDAGLQYNFVSYGQVEAGELLRGGYRVLILPRSSALSAAESRAMHEFVAQGGVLLADGDAGVFDEHGRRLPQSQLADLFQPGGQAIHVTANVLDYHRERVLGKGLDTRDAMAKIFHDTGVRPEFAVTGEDGHTAAGVETFVFRNGGVKMLALHVNPELRIQDLGPPDFKSNERFAQTRALKVALPGPRYVYDVRRGKALGRLAALDVRLDPYEPAIYSLSDEALPDPRIAAPARIARGELGRLGFSTLARTPAATHVFHVEVTGPDGKPLPRYSGNVLAPGGRALWKIPVALNDAAGEWNVRVTDVLTGATQTAKIEVF